MSLGLTENIKDNEIAGVGNNVDFEARNLNSRLGRWSSMDERAEKSPQLSPYVFVSNRPIINIDPDGNTDFWFGGKWVGTDGVDNKLIGILSDDRVARRIQKRSLQGKTYTKFGALQNGSEKTSLFVVHSNVLVQTERLFEKAFSEQGAEAEYSGQLTDNLERKVPFTRTPVTFDYDANGNKYYSGGGLTSGLVSFHSHPTGPPIENWQGDIEIPGDITPSPEYVDRATGELRGDVRVFRNFGMNVIVGYSGGRFIVPPPTIKNPFPKPVYHQGAPSAGFYNNSSSRRILLNRDSIKTLIQGPSGDIYEKYKQQSAPTEIPNSSSVDTEQH